MSNQQPSSSHEEHAEASAAFALAEAPRLAIAGEQKWMAVSQLQKAIRRNQPAVALEWAHALWNADRAYGLFRLGVVACEEVAGANPALARAFLQTEIKKAWFESRGGFSALAYFVDAFARSPKDRTSCDLASVASISHLEGIAAPRGALDFGALRAVAEDASAPTPKRVSALWLLAGTNKSSNPAALGPDRPGRLLDFLGACDSISPGADLLACVDMSLRLNKEPNPIALALCRAAQGSSTLSETLEVPTTAIGHGLSCAVDAHTREGREALDKLLESSSLAQAICSPLRAKADKARLLGSLFFRLEGHEVSPRIDYPLARKTQGWHRTRLARLAARPEPELFEEAKLLLPELDELRMRAAPWAFASARPTAKP